MQKVLISNKSTELLNSLTIKAVSNNLRKTRDQSSSNSNNYGDKFSKVKNHTPHFELRYRRKSDQRNSSQSPEINFHKKKLESFGYPKINMLPLLNNTNNQNHMDCFNSIEINKINRSFLEHRTYYLLKLAKTTELYDSLKDKIKEIKTESRVSTLEDLHKKIKIITEKQSQILLDPKITSITFDEIGLKNQIKTFFDFFNYITKYIDSLLSEIKLENEKFVQYQLKVKEIKNIKKIKEKKEKNCPKEKEKEVSQIDNKPSIQVENALMIKVKKLQEETNDLSTLLDKTKHYYIEYKKQLSQLSEKEIEISNMNVEYSKVLKLKEMNLGLFRNELEQKNELINSLKKEIGNLTSTIENSHSSLISLKNITLHLQEQLEQSFENIQMKDEEINMLLLLITQEKRQHEVSKQTIISLESIIANLKQEQKKPNDFITKI